MDLVLRSPTACTRTFVRAVLVLVPACSMLLAGCEKEAPKAQRSLFTSQLNYTQTQAAVFQSLVNIYKALGGGWVQEAEKVADQASAPAAAAAGN